MSRILSFEDLFLVPEIKQMVLEGREEDFAKAIYELGVDTNYVVETDVCFHRTLQGKVVYGLRLVGTERIDEEWMKSGYASEEARKRVIAKYDLELLKDIEEMSIEGSTMGALIDHLESHWGWCKEMDKDIEVSN